MNITLNSGIIRYIVVLLESELVFKWKYYGLEGKGCIIKRTVIKLSGEAIGDPQAVSGYNDPVIDSIVLQIIRIIQSGTQVSLVIGGGNLWRGQQARPDMCRVKADSMGMLATVINAIYLAEAFKRQGAKALVMTPIPFANMTRIYEKETALELMENKTVLIYAAGLGHPYFSTDTITALRAAELEADIVLYAKNIDGVYDADPRQAPAARKYKTLSYTAAIQKGLNAADIAAMHISKESNIPSYIFGLNTPDSITLACRYPHTATLNGTYIHEDKKEDYYVNSHTTL
ncbi:MAG: UMP kinase [Defluviitaleaceae bacterium]|nr:UMP kinase [Defluviitaleaceae bacterium]